MSFGRLNFRVPSPASERKALIPSIDTVKRKDTEVLNDDELKTAKRQRRSGGKHQMAACCACKRKRKKCDGKYPSCSGCLNSQLECTILDQTTGRTIPRDYIQRLEEKIEHLKKEIVVSHDIKSTMRDLSESNSGKHKENLERDIGFITLGATAESRFIGQSSAFSIARAITESINYYNKPTRILRNGLSLVQDVLTDDQVFTKPSPYYANKYMETYESSVQCQYPFLDWNLIKEWYECVYLRDSKDQEKVFFIYMIFAIGAQINSGSFNTGYNASSSTIKSYYKKAFDNIDYLIKDSTLETVQIYLLLSVFSQHMPDGTSIWQTTGLAIRTAVTLGLHRKPYKSVREQQMNPSDYQKFQLDLRARVFWSAYSLERINGIVLGRPFGISDIDIDVPLPEHHPGIPVACHVFKLRRIQSNICSFVYKPIPLMEMQEDIDSTRVSIVLELNDWMSTFPAKKQPISRFETFNWCSVSYHNSMLLLLRPVVLEVSRTKLNSPARSIEWFKAFTHSASAICLNYKDLHGKGKLNSTWLSMHCLFVAGLSFLYCLWIDSQIKVLEWKNKKVVYDTISACSSILYVLAERWTSAVVFRDTFEQISSAVLVKLDDSNVISFPINQNKNDSGLSSSFNKLIEGALDSHTIGIDQYLSYESQAWKTDSERDQMSVGSTPGKGAESSAKTIQQASIFDSFDLSLWEFLDTTSDRFLRDIYHDMETNLGNI